MREAVSLECDFAYSTFVTLLGVFRDKLATPGLYPRLIKVAYQSYINSREIYAEEAIFPGQIPV